MLRLKFIPFIFILLLWACRKDPKDSVHDTFDGSGVNYYGTYTVIDSFFNSETLIEGDLVLNARKDNDSLLVYGEHLPISWNDQTSFHITKWGTSETFYDCDVYFYSNYRDIEIDFNYPIGNDPIYWKFQGSMTNMPETQSHDIQHMDKAGLYELHRHSEYLDFATP